MKRDHIILITVAVLFLIIACRTGVSYYSAKDRCQEFKDKLAREVTGLSRKHAQGDSTLRKKLLTYRDELTKHGRCDLSGRRAVGAVERNGREPGQCDMFDKYMNMNRNKFIKNKFGDELRPKFCKR